MKTISEYLDFIIALLVANKEVLGLTEVYDDHDTTRKVPEPAAFCELGVQGYDGGGSDEYSIDIVILFPSKRDSSPGPYRIQAVTLVEKLKTLLWGEADASAEGYAPDEIHAKYGQVDVSGSRFYMVELTLKIEV